MLKYSKGVVKDMSNSKLKVMHQGSSNHKRRERLDKMVIAVVKSGELFATNKDLVNYALSILLEIDKRICEGE